ncbi:MAG: hypothetical protein JNL98_36735 [Bryobacterales bacterium]|nr:hypothetical protein [Bryobacterales bacterium]
MFHSDHSAELSARYLAIAQRLGLAVTGGSDYHGAAKPNVHLGRLGLEWHWLESLRNLTT